MKLELRARHRIMDSRLRQLCDRYLFYALGRFEDRIRRVQLSIEDVSGPRGGRDSRCVLRVGLRHGGALSVESTEMRPEVAVAVFHRARAALVRTVERRRWAPMRRHLRLAPSLSRRRGASRLRPSDVPRSSGGTRALIARALR